MPASSFDLYPMHDARKNFDAMRPAPICTDTNHISQSQNIHISTNCYYGYDLKKYDNLANANDCEMVEVAYTNNMTTQNNARKRSANDSEYPQSKRLREEGTVPSTSNSSNYNPCLLRPTHNTPDISRCLMVHMI